MIRIKDKGQVTIFVIIAVVLAAGILMIFLFKKTPTISRGQDFDNPESFIDECVRKSADETLKIMLPQGGFVEPKDYKLYEDIKVAYLCKNINDYEPCVNQHPRFMFELQDELSREIDDEVGQCFALLEEELEKKNYAVSGGDISVESTLKPGVVEILINREFEMKKGDFARSFDKFNVFLRSAVYELAYLANEISAQEAGLCYFSNDGYMALYPQYDIKKDVMSDSTKIYSLKDKETQLTMNIAIRGCVVPLVGS